MRQRGKRPGAALGINPAPSGDGRLGTPADLSPIEAALFRQVVANSPAGHFALCDLPLMISFVHATLLSRSTANDPKQIQVWERAVRMQASLATKLRLTPQARTDTAAAGRRQANFRPPSAYDNLDEMFAETESDNGH